MPGDARKKGGSYSTNPSTVRIRAYEANLSPDRLALRKAKFSEYRSLREACLRASEKDEYKSETTRDGKLHLLSVACHNKIAERKAVNRYMCGTNINEYVIRFHDSRWEKRLKAASNPENAAGDIAGDYQVENPNVEELHATIAEQEETIMKLLESRKAITEQLNLVTDQVSHLSEVAIIQQTRLDTVEAKAQKDREAFKSVLAVLAEFEV
ncbi:uncharacterized protein CTRU02_207764 [Colletotrichum truncatum]|uniref:Uncharacterized protein n=1 Tax=Colletotrichum truncatum TaxID=5467 RepID=A0ACC3Z1R6_COLTU|nr:uncharacterized protein CTRU02_09135 [Colletotrichum truncatum]KAF6788814.1 hypothetical protein CTRU02_09135 [Colletotrichum truncatum]